VILAFLYWPVVALTAHAIFHGLLITVDWGAGGVYILSIFYIMSNFIGSRGVLMTNTYLSKLRLVPLIYLLLSAGTLRSQEVDIESLYKLPLEELLKVRVTTSSKFEESLHDAHASISIITSQQISQFGANNLFELLERVVSVNSNFGVMTSITTRGSKPWTSLFQHLGLINGRPFGNLTGAHSLYTSMPLTAIERIEYIRGPGSVLYGSNAYQGVFNIITKDIAGNGWQAQQKVTLGSFQTKLMDGSYQYRKDKLKLGLNLLLSDVDGWDANMVDPTTMQSYSRKVFQTEQTAHVEIEYADFSFSHYNSQQERFGNFWDAPEANYIPWSKVHPVQLTNLSYNYNFSEDWRLESHITDIRKTMEWSSEGIADESIRIKSPLKIRLYEFNLFGEFSKKTSFVTGLTHETRIIKGAATIPDAEEDYASIYFQFQHQLTSAFSYSLGGQYVTSLNLVAGVSNKSDFVPRVGFVYDLNDDWAIKLLYGQAYRQPSAGERTIETPEIQKGTPGLKSETIDTTELQLFYQTNSAYLTLTYYQNEERNLILLVPSDDPLYALENRNWGEISSHGIELEFKYQLDKNWLIEFSSSWQQNKNEDGVKNTNLSPNNSWKLGIGYNAGDWSVGLYNLHYSNYHDTIVFDPNRELVNPPAEGFDWLTLKVTNKLITFDNSANLELSLEVKNILDEEVYQPNDTPVFYPTNTLPGREGRSFFASMTYNY